MSSFVVDKAHISAILRGAWAVTRRDGLYYFHQGPHLVKLGDRLAANKIGQMLLEENVCSVMGRYPDSDITNLPGRIDAEWLVPFEARMVGGGVPTPVQLLKLLSCYEYQSCDHEEWEQSEAKAFCDSLRGYAISHLPGYEEALWEWVDPVDPRRASVS